MKVRVTVNRQPGHTNAVMQGAGRALTRQEIRELIAWATARGVDPASIMGVGGHFYRLCVSCNEVTYASASCQHCLFLVNASMSSSREEAEHTAQVCERMATQLAEMSIELQKRANMLPAAEPLEIAEIDNGLRSLLESAVGKDLDRWAAIVGFRRKTTRAPYSSVFEWETDEALRERVRAKMNPALGQ